ncbi:MAG: ACT domain-containing protein [Planctomycetaceae bacterium]|nr:ACT domain-containing protein [Planctomycetaceae bacterium]
MISLVITLVGPDRPGIVGIVADSVRQSGGNWLESRMAHLAGEFAGIVLVEVDDGGVDALIASINQLNQHGLRVIVQQDQSSAAAPVVAGIAATVRVMGTDRPGIVREVTQVLAAHQVNVEELTTNCTVAPMSGGRVFHASIRLSIPSGVSLPVLQDQLEQIAADLMVEIDLTSGE